MVSNRLRKWAVLLTLGLGLSGVTTIQALAQGTGTGLYFGASAGITTADVCDDIGGPGISCDDEDTGLKIFGGFGVNPNFAVELGWVDVGEATATGPGGTATLEADGFQFAAVGIFPIGQRFDVFGKIGMYMWDASVSGPGGSVSDDGTDLMFGIGGTWKIGQRLGLRAEWERFDVDDIDIDLVSVGVTFSFK
jgi:OOP family OmpA-OmpF porin